MANQPGCSGKKPNETHDMKTDTETNQAAANKAADAADTVADAAATPQPTKAEKKKAKADEKKTAAALKAKEKKAADKVKADDKAAASKVKADDKAAASKLKADEKQMVVIERGMTPLIKAGLAAMNMVGNGNQAWTIAAFKMRELCKGTPVNFKDEALEHWGVQKNTATKLANAGELLAGLIAADAIEGGGVEKDKWLACLPMGSVNNLSVISGFTDAKIDKGIDLDIIRIDATEADISAFARDYNDKGEQTVVETVPAADAEDAGEDAGEPAATVSDSETPGAFISRVTFEAESLKLTPANRIKLAVALTADFNSKRVDELFAALDAVHPGAG